MGCDGGTIPKRDELVKTKKKPEQKDKVAEQIFRWRHCAISQENLKPPIVACKLGRLYNKDKLIEALLNRESKPETIAHIKNLKDVKELNLTPNPAFKDCLPEKGDAYVDTNISPYICPVVGLEMNGNHKFCFVWKCGCVLSERSLRNIPTSICHKCQQSFKTEDVITLNPGEDELIKIKSILLEKSLVKKRSAESDNQLQSKKLKLLMASRSEFIPVQKHEAGYTVAKDPTCSETYKSIFTSHPSAKKKDIPHWVTYNPFYN